MYAYHSRRGCENVLLCNDEFTCLVLYGLDNFGVAVASRSHTNTCAKMPEIGRSSVHNRAYAEKPNLTAGHIEVFLTICGPDIAPFSLFGYEVLQVKFALHAGAYACLAEQARCLQRLACRYRSAPNISRQLEQDAC